MSTEDLGRYVGRLQSDPALRTELAEAARGLEGRAALEQAAAHARAHGFAVDAGDIAALEGALAGQEGELDDRALESVAGGTGFHDIAKAFAGIMGFSGGGSPALHKRL